jgi:hypothetical protein
MPARSDEDEEPKLASCFHDSSVPHPSPTPTTPSGIYARRESPSVPRLYDGPPPVALTAIAAHAHTVADTVRAAFGAPLVGGLTVELTVPEQTTKGGLLALQHLVLRSPAGHTVVVGAVNVVEKYAELRSYEFVRRACELRFEAPPLFDAFAYGAIVERAAQVFENFGLTIRVADPWEDLAPPSSAPGWAIPEELTRITFYAACVVMAAALIVALLR